MYLPGEYMMTESNRDKICICERNKTGVSTSSCRKFNRWFDVHAAAGFYRNCVPVYPLYGVGRIGIKRVTWACPNVNDEISDRFYDDQEKSKYTELCSFGQMTMRIGDTLSPIR